MKKRILSLLLAACMLLTLMPMAALADGGTKPDFTGWTVLNTYAESSSQASDDAIDLDSGKYYLTGDLNIGNRQLCIRENQVVTIDLNGHVLSSSNKDFTIKVFNNSNLTVQDSNPNADNTVNDKAVTGGYIVNNGHDEDDNPGNGVNVETGSTFTLKSGTIYSKGYCVSLTASTFYADGGIIDENVRLSYYQHKLSTITRHSDATDYTTFNGRIVDGQDNPTDANDAAKLTVNFVNGDKTETKKVLKGQKISAPTTPPTTTESGKIFGCWVDAEGNAWDFDAPVLEHDENGEVTLTAKWLTVTAKGGGGDCNVTVSEAAPDAAVPNHYKDLITLAKFNFSYKDENGNSPDSATVTVSGVSDIDNTKPMYVFVKGLVNGFTTHDRFRVYPDTDGNLTFTIDGKYLSGCTVFITQPTYEGTLSVNLADNTTEPTKLTKNAGGKYEITYKVTADFVGKETNVDIYVNGIQHYTRNIKVSGTSNTASYTITLSADNLKSGLPSVYASCVYEYNPSAANQKHLYISETYKPDINVVEFKDDSNDVIAVYLVPNGTSFGDELPTLTKDDSIFDCWESEGNTVDADTPITDNMVLTPKWADVTKVTFDPKNGDEKQSFIVREYDSLGSDMPEDPVKSGYTFVGWFYINNDGIEQKFTADTEVFDENVNVYAKWQSNAPTYYTLTYVSNGGTEYAPERYVYGTVVKLDKVPVREGYDFTGWYADSGLTEKIDSIRMNYFKTVYAGWEKQTVYYTLSYVSNGGTEYADETYAEGTVVTLDKLPTREGYVFTGWYADEALTAAVESVEMTSDKVVYAGWKGEYVPPELNSGDHIAYVKGYDDGTVKPLNDITRAETAMMLYRLLTDEHRAEIYATTNSFADVAASDWYNEAVSTMANGGYITGYVDSTFGGNNSITRAEFVAILVRFIGVVDGAQCDFSDVPADHWAYDYIATATTAGWIVGSPDGRFNPDALITRAEAMTIINRVLDRGIDGSSTLPEFKLWPDNSPDDWFYYDVIEATNGHEYTGSRPNENWTSVEK